MSRIELTIATVEDNGTTWCSTSWVLQDVSWDEVLHSTELDDMLARFAEKERTCESCGAEWVESDFPDAPSVTCPFCGSNDTQYDYMGVE